MISIRLVSLTKYISYNDKVIDIGCDHALLDIYLIKNNIVKKIIASDTSENALNYGIANIEKEKLENKIETRLGNGLEVITPEDNIDTVIMSGMGTSTILSILTHPYIYNLNKLVIQSNNDHTLLRQELTQKGFYVKAEDFIFDNGKNYINIVFERGEKKLSKNELRYGPILIHNKNYLNFELENCQKIYKMIPKKKWLIRHRLNKEIKLLQKLMK